MLSPVRFALLTLTLLLVAPQVTRADDADRLKTAEELLLSMKVDKQLAEAVDTMLDVQLKQNPAMAKFRAPMKAFLSKHLSWEAIKTDMIKLYAEEFTEKELNDMKAFYKSPVGLKLAEKQAKLSAKQMELGMKRVQDNQAELKKMIEDELKK